MQAISHLIRTHHPAILRDWTEAAKRAVSAKNLSSAELASLMPEYLTLLGDTVATPDAGLSAAQRALIERHLSNRLREGYNLSEILTEFAILGRSIQRVLSLEADGERPSIAAVTALYAELYQTSTAVTRIFNEHLLEDEQMMKRYTRLLGQIASAPSGGEAPSVRLQERVSEALALVVEAMGAHTAVLLLEGASDLPATTAVGARAAELAKVAQALETTTFADGDGAIDVEAAEVPVTALQVQLGVGVLLRVRLAAHDTLRCVLYVGMQGERRFTAGEVRRFEGLAAALTFHLDNARLRSAHGRKAREVEAERELRERVVGVLVREIRGPLENARSGARRLATDATGGTAVALDLANTLGRILRVVDECLATTPVVADTDPR